MLPACSGSKSSSPAPEANRITNSSILTGINHRIFAVDPKSGVIFIANEDSAEIIVKRGANSTFKTFHLESDAPALGLQIAQGQLFVVSNNRLARYDLKLHRVGSALTPASGMSFTSMAVVGNSLYLAEKFNNGGGRIQVYTLNPDNLQFNVNLAANHGYIVGSHQSDHKLFTASVDNIKREVYLWNTENNTLTNNLGYVFGKSYSLPGRLIYNPGNKQIYVLSMDGDTAYDGKIPVYIRTNDGTDYIEDTANPIKLPFQPAALAVNDSYLFVLHKNYIINPTEVREHEDYFGIHLLDPTDHTETVTLEADNSELVDLAVVGDVIYVLAHQNHLYKISD